MAVGFLPMCAMDAKNRAEPHLNETMSTNRGIFESFPSQASRQDSPFTVVPENDGGPAAASPFEAAERQQSPFTVVDEAAGEKPAEFSRPVKLPERRRMDSPFQVAEPSEGFGFEAQPAAISPFEAVAQPPASSPFAAAPQQPAAAPFAVEPQLAAPAAALPAAGFGRWAQEPAAAVPPVFAPPAFGEPVVQPFAAAPAPAAFAVPAAAPAPAGMDYPSDSQAIRQLELRAIFGVDRELSADEMLQRARALPGIRNLARVAAADLATIEGLKHLLPNLGFGTGLPKLYVGSVPLEFIREGAVVLAVQTDGSFAPGVRETLMIIARELGRLG